MIFHVLANYKCISVNYQENENYISLNVTFKSIRLIIVTEKDYLLKMFQNILIII